MFKTLCFSLYNRTIEGSPTTFAVSFDHRSGPPQHACAHARPLAVGRDERPLQCALRLDPATPRGRVFLTSQSCLPVPSSSRFLPRAPSPAATDAKPELPCTACRSPVADRRYKETLDKEKDQRRAWAAHTAAKEVFDTNTPEFVQLNGLQGMLDNLCAEPSRTGRTDSSKPELSKRKQCKLLRDEIRTTLANVDKRAHTCRKSPPLPWPTILHCARGATPPPAPPAVRPTGASAMVSRCVPACLRVPASLRVLVTLLLAGAVRDLADLAGDDAEKPDPMLEKARAAARERLKLPPHLRGSALLNETLMSGGA